VGAGDVPRRAALYQQQCLLLEYAVPGAMDPQLHLIALVDTKTGMPFALYR
jgi:hypothetical protein